MSCTTGASTGRLARAQSASGHRCRRPFVAAAASADGAAAAPRHEATSPMQRRQLLSLSLLAPAAAAVLAAVPGAALAEEAAAAAAVAAPPAPAPAAAGPTTYTDAEDKFSILVPAGWAQGSGAIGESGTLTTNQARFSNAAGLRRVVAFFPEGKPEVNVTVTVQFIGPDYTALGSFGTAQQFAEGVINKMDNSYLLRLPEWRRAKESPVQVAKLVDVRADSKDKWVFSYTLDKVGEPQRTVVSSVAMGNNGRYNRLYTVNATCTAGDVAQYGPVLKQVVDSFKAPGGSA